MQNNKKYCPFCGEEIRKDATSCAYCGERLVLHLLDGKDLFKEIRDLFSDRFDVLEEQFDSGICVSYKVVTRTDYKPYLLTIQNPYLQADAAQAERFEQLSKIAQKLNHQHIWPVEQLGRMNGIAYTLSPYRQVENLRKKITATGGLAADECIKIVTQVGEALHYAHAKGIVHGRLSSEQIWYSRTGEVYVTGFGYEAKPEVNERPDELGAYLSPEQFMGLPFDFRTDIYGLGVLFYECLSGGLTQEMQDGRVLIGSYKSGQSVYSLMKRKGKLKEYDTALKRALSYNPKNRYDSVQSFVKALQKREASAIKERKEKEEQAKAQDLLHLKDSGLAEEYVSKHDGRLDESDYEQFLKGHGYFPIDDEAVRELLDAAVKAYNAKKTTPPRAETPAQEHSKHLKYVELIGNALLIIFGLWVLLGILNLIFLN